MFASVLQPFDMYRSGSGSIREVFTYKRTARVYKHYTRQDCPIENTETAV